MAKKISTFADLFCGIGGFHYAAKLFDLKCVFANDNNQKACSQYLRNLGDVLWGDIAEIPSEEIPDHDLLFAGFPCQPFSVIGNRKGRDDERGNLVDEAVRVIRDKKPKAFILENVKQFSSDNNGLTLSMLIEDLTNIGYKTSWKILNALDFGLPQKRERCFIVGILENEMRVESFGWPYPLDPDEDGYCFRSLEDVLEDNPDPRHFVSEKIKRKRKAVCQSDLRLSIWHENKSKTVTAHPYSCALRANASHNYLLVNGERRLTVREQLRLQGFPEDFVIDGSDSRLRNQIGNSVAVPVVEAIIGEILLSVK